MSTPEERQRAIEKARARIRAQESVVIQEREKTSQAGAFGRGLTQGASFGFADELLANLSGLKTAVTETGQEKPGDTIRAFIQARDLSMLESQANRGSDRERFPKTALAGELIGGAGTGGATFRALNTAGRVSGLPLAARVPGVGAIEGGLFGAGTANPGERTSGALTGAGIGAIGTPLLAGAGVSATRVLRPFAERLGNSLFGTPADQARKQIIRALDAEDITLDEADVLMRSLGRNTVLADLGDTLTRQGRVVTSELGGGASRARDFLDARQRASGLELTQAARRATGSNDFDRGIIEIVNGAESRAKPIYDEVFSEVLDVTPAMASLLDRPAMKSAQKKAAVILKNEGFSDEIVQDVTDVRYMDAVKRALGDAESSAIRSGNNNQARILGQLRRDFVSEIDSQVPRYAEARSIFAGEQAMRDAADFGRTMLVGKKDPVDIVEQISSMGESELTAARMGFLRWMSGELASQSVNSNRLANKFADTPKFRQIIQNLFPSQDAVNEFIQTASAQSQFARTRNTILGGSPTARIQADRSAMSPGILGAFAEGAVDPASGLARALSLFGSNTSLSQEVLQEMGEILFNPRIIPSRALRRSTLPSIFEIPRGDPAVTAGSFGGLIGSQQDAINEGLIGAGLIGQ